MGRPRKPDKGDYPRRCPLCYLRPVIWTSLAEERDHNRLVHHFNHGTSNVGKVTHRTQAKTGGFVPHKMREE